MLHLKSLDFQIQTGKRIQDKEYNKQKVLPALPFEHGQQQHHQWKGTRTFGKFRWQVLGTSLAECAGPKWASNESRWPGVSERTETEEMITIDRDIDMKNYLSTAACNFINYTGKNNVLIISFHAQFPPLNVLSQPYIVTKKWMRYTEIKVWISSDRFWNPNG